MMRKSFFTVLYFLCVVCNSLAVKAANGDSHTKDSLRHVIATTQGKAKLSACKRLVKIYFLSARKGPAMDSLTVALACLHDEALRQHDTLVLCSVQATQLSAWLNAGMIDEVATHAPEIINSIARLNAESTAYYDAYSCYISALMKQQHSERAIEAASKLYDSCKKRDDALGVATALSEMSKIYVETGRLHEAESSITEAIDLVKDREPPLIDLSNYYYRAALVYRLQNRFDKALQFAQTCESCIHRSEQQTGMPQKGLWVNCLRIYSSIYEAMGEFDKADEYLAREEALGIGGAGHKVNTLRARARLMERAGKNRQALILADSVLAFWPRYNTQSCEALWIKASALAKMGRSDEAIIFFKQVIDVNDSIRNTDFARNLDGLRTQYEVDKLSAASEKAQLRLFWVSVAVALLLIILVGAVFNARRINAKNHAMVRQIDEMKTLLDEQTRRLFDMLTPSPQYDAQGELCTESRYDLLCIRLRDRLLKEHAYLDPTLSAEGLMRELGVNRKSFVETFKRCFGTTFPKYINMLRLKEAITLLESTDRQMEDIAESSGFGSDRWFRKVFRECYNMSPLEYRKMKRKKMNQTAINTEYEDAKYASI